MKREDLIRLELSEAQARAVRTLQERETSGPRPSGGGEPQERPADGTGPGGEPGGRDGSRAPQEEAERLRREFEAETARLRTENAVCAALYEAGARDPQTVLPKIDLSLVRLENGKLTGLEGQLSQVRRHAGYLFAGREDGREVSSGAAHGSAPGQDPLAAFTASARAAAGLRD